MASGDCSRPIRCRTGLRRRRSVPTTSRCSNTGLDAGTATRSVLCPHSPANKAALTGGIRMSGKLMISYPRSSPGLRKRGNDAASLVRPCGPEDRPDGTSWYWKGSRSLTPMPSYASQCSNNLAPGPQAHCLAAVGYSVKHLLREIVWR